MCAFTPVIIIGAPRSGTNMLRDLLTAFPGFETWPCDEINPIWRHGNRDLGHDQLPPSRATKEVSDYIRGRFARLARRSRATHIVEKTCANTLRVPFVDAVMPTARFVSIVRDGREAALSAVERWRSPVDLPYTLRKLRFVPPSDIVGYGASFLRNRLHQRRAPNEALHAWGPVFEGLDEAVRRHPLSVVCARQWTTCVLEATDGLAGLPSERCFHLRYEDLVAAPGQEVMRLLEWLDIAVPSATVARATAPIASTHGGRWPAALPEAERAEFLDALRPGLQRLGYDTEVSDAW